MGKLKGDANVAESLLLELKFTMAVADTYWRVYQKSPL